MEAPPSPTSTASFLSEDEWDIVTDESQDGRLSPAPISGSEADVDELHHARDVDDVLSDSSSSFDDTDQGPGALLRESDRRVSNALAAPLSSTLDPFRDPLPSYILTSSLSSSESGSGLILSFPDPLTAQEPIKSPNEAQLQDPIEVKEETPIVDQAPLRVSQASTAPSIDFTIVEEGNRPEAPIWAAEATAAVEEVIVSEKDADYIRKLAFRAKRSKFIEALEPKPAVRARRPSVNTIARILQTQGPAQSWTTSMYEVTIRRKYTLKFWFSIVSVLVLVLGSALYAVRTQRTSTAPTPVQMIQITPTPQIAQLCGRPGNAHSTLIAGNTAVQPSLASSVLLLQTPGAGPSTATTGQKGGMPSTAQGPNAVAVADTKKCEVAKVPSTGATRGASATPLPIRSGFWSKGKGKEKETEVVEIVLHDEVDSSEVTARSTLLLEGPKAALNLGYLYRDVLTGLKASFSAIEDGGGGLTLSKARFDELIDEFVNRIIVRTTDILRELTKNAEAIFADSTENIIKPGVQAARKIAREMKAHHRRAGWTARRSLRAVIGGVQAHHERVKSNCKRIEGGLRAAAKEGHRFLAEALAEVQDV